MAKQEWSVSLVGIDGKTLRTAFERIKQAGDAFPPSLPKFLTYCRGSNGWAHRGQAYRLHVKALPKPVNRAVGRKALSGLRAAL